MLLFYRLVKNSKKPQKWVATKALLPTPPPPRSVRSSELRQRHSQYDLTSYSGVVGDQSIEISHPLSPLALSCNEVWFLFGLV